MLLLLLFGHSFLVKKCPWMMVALQLNQTQILSDKTIIANLTSIKLTFSFLPIHLVDTTSSTTPIYLRKNWNDIAIPPNLWHLPTTLKAVVNANAIVFYIKIQMDSENCTWTVKFVMLKMQYKILACGIICANRRGWD